MKNDLIERYVYAVTSGLPEKQRDDVGQELEGLIKDMLTERCGEVLPEEKDVLVVLTELGTPRALQRKYLPDGKNYLIGPDYFHTYRFLLKIVLGAVFLGMTVSSVVLQFLSPETGWIEAAARWLGLLWEGSVYGFAFLTALFAFFEYKQVKVFDGENLRDLPPVPKKSQVISKWEPIVGIVISILFMTVFLFAPQVFAAVVTTDGGAVIPIFNTEMIQSRWYIIVLFGAAGMTREIFRLLEGRYNQRVLITTVFADLVSGVLTIWWLGSANILNPAFVSSVTEIFSKEDAVIQQLFSNFHLFFMGVILFALALDMVDTIVRTRIAQKNNGR